MAKQHGTYQPSGTMLSLVQHGTDGMWGPGREGGTDDSTMSVTDAEKRDFDMCVFYEQW